MELDAAAQVGCVVVEALEGAGACRCEERDRRPVPPEHAALAAELSRRLGEVGVAADCVCEVPQLAGAAAEACRHDPSPSPTLHGMPISGFCYLDATTAPPVGNPDLLAHCPASAVRDLRFLGGAEQAPGSARLTYCEQRLPCDDPA